MRVHQKLLPLALWVVTSTVAVKDCRVPLYIQGEHYFMSVIKSFSKGHPISVEFGNNGEILYSFENKTYSYRENEHLEVTDLSVSRAKYGTIKTTTDDGPDSYLNFLYAVSRKTIFYIEIKNETQKLYAVEKDNFLNFEQLVKAEEIVEVGTNIVDIDVNYESGNVIVAVHNKSNSTGQLITLIKKQRQVVTEKIHFMQEENAVRKTIKKVVQSMGEKVVNAVLNVAKGSKTEMKCSNKDQNTIDHLHKIYEKLIKEYKIYCDRYAKQSAKKARRDKRDAGNDNDKKYYCISSEGFSIQKEILKQVEDDFID